MEVADYCCLDFDLEAIIPVLVDLEDNMLDRCKKNFFYFFGHVFYVFLTFFYFPNVFYLKKTAKFIAASRLTRSTFKITATK